MKHEEDNIEQEIYDGKESEDMSEQDTDTTGRPELTLKEYIEEVATEEDQQAGSKISMRTILGGDILYTKPFRNQIGLIILILFFSIIYISNRYRCQNDQLEIDRLNKQLKDAQYKALAISSELTEHCRESHVLEMLKLNNDSTLHTADQPPYIIIVNNNE